jgi:hypothetical protein
MGKQNRISMLQKAGHFIDPCCISYYISLNCAPFSMKIDDKDNTHQIAVVM